MPSITGKRVLVLVGCLIVVLSGAAFSRTTATPDLRVFHAAFILPHDAISAHEGIEKNVGQFLTSTFGSASGEGQTPLPQVLSTLSEQARSDGWTSLRLDVWVGGRKAPIGYYLQYEGKGPTGAVVRGGAFAMSPRDLPLWLASEEFLTRQSEVHEWRGK